MDARTWSAIVAEHAVHSLLNARLVREEDVPRAEEIVADQVHYRLCLRDVAQPVVSQGDRDASVLASEIERTLQSLTFVSKLDVHFPVSRPGFWERCRLLTPQWRHAQPPRIFVDGFVSACKWNSWKVYTEWRESGLSLWSGYAFSTSHWTAHSWCMLGDRFVETGAPFRIYYGAELNASEIDELGKESAALWESSGKKPKLVWTMVNGEREVVRYTETEHAHSMGRERDPQTGAIKEGLGR